ncbi:MAG: EamA family transporter [Atopobiaceae bacterium]|nr:EamA family transporter [Atopobiaceae bacterium]MBR1829346.1 EamA family transporter [Atopobiaceae bacterium]
MLSYVWPIALVVLSNTIYQICSKSVPGDLNPFASLTVTYLVGALASVVLYHVFNRGGSFAKEFGRLNWAPFVLGFVVVGLEVGFIFAYRAGWQVSAAAVVQSGFLAISLLLVGTLFYHEPLTSSKIIGIALCIVGLIFINR